MNFEGITIYQIIKELQYIIRRQERDGCITMQERAAYLQNLIDRYTLYTLSIRKMRIASIPGVDGPIEILQRVRLTDIDGTLMFCWEQDDPEPDWM